MTTNEDKDNGQGFGAIRCHSLLIFLFPVLFTDYFHFFPDSSKQNATFSPYIGMEKSIENEAQAPGGISNSGEFTANLEWVNNTAPAITISGEEFKKSEIDLVTQVNAFFKSIGGKIEHTDLGEIVLDKRSIKNSIAHGIGRIKAAAFKAVPEVIKNGKIIDYQYNWKGRGYNTAVIAAPVIIGNAKYIVKVIIEQIDDKKYRFYLHEAKIKKT